MNERIHELADLADIYARSDNSSMLFENYKKRYSEKFAELIVRECVELTHWQDFDISVEQRIRLSVAQDIKQHFGIKE